MELFKEHKKRKLIGFSFLGAFIATVTGLVINQINPSLSFRAKGSGVSPYTITLDSTNKVTSNGDHVNKTAAGNDVVFTYSSVAGSTTGHVTLQNGGSLVNKDHIRSIESFRCNYTINGEATLKFQTSYGGDVWSGETVLENNYTYDFGSYPYFIKISCTGGSATINTVNIGFNCNVNPAAHEGETGEEEHYELTITPTKVANAGVTSTSSSSTQDGDFTIDDISYRIDHVYIYSDSSSNTFISFGQSTDGKIYNKAAFDGKINSISVVYRTRYNGDLNSEIGNLYVSNTGNNTGWTNYSESVCSAGSYSYFKFSYEGVTFSNYSNIKSITISLTRNLGPTYDTPTDEIGFTADDSKKNDYTTNSIFDNENGLTVIAQHVGGGEQVVSPSDYSYKVYNSLSEEIDTSEKFTTEGIYTLVVSYKNYIPQEIQLLVGEYVYLTDISASITKVSYTTADNLSGHLSKLTSVLSYSNGTTQEEHYDSAEYALLGIGLTLTSPKGFTHEMTSPFGSAGTWTLTVYDIVDPEIKDTIDLTVEAIMVTSVTLNEETLNLYVGDTEHQLVATVNPGTATNSLLTWNSSNENAVTVDQEGNLVAVAVGSSIITATSTDGTNVYGSCTVNVTEQPQPSDTGDFEKISFSDLEVGMYVLIVGQQNSNYYAMTSQATNNRSSTDVTVSENVITRESTDSFRAFEVKSGTTSNSFAFYDPTDEGYLYAAGGDSKNYLRTQSTNDEKSSFVLDGGYLKASISGRNIFLFNHNDASNRFFSCYGNTTTNNTTNIQLFANSSGSSSSTPIYPTSISLSGNNSISIGETSQLTVGFTPSDTNVQNVTYESKTPSVATVSNTGLVTGVSAGTSKIVATAVTANGTTTAERTITVSKIDVTGLSLDSSSGTVKVGKTITFVPTISPSNATNKTVNWSTSDSSIATVTNGVVKGIGAGTATITARSADNNTKYAQATVTVTASSVASEWTLVTSASSLAAGDVIVIASNAEGKVAGDISSQLMTDIDSSFSGDKETIEDLGSGAIQLTLGGEEGAWTLSNDNGQLLGATAVKKLAWNSGTTTWSISISGGDATIQNGTSSYGRFLYNTGNPRFTTYTSGTSASMLLPQIYRGGTAEPTNPTSISLSSTSVELAPGGTTNLSVSYNPKNANQNKEVTWLTSNSSVATVEDGLVTVKTTATEGQSATITAKLTNLPSITATCTVSVVKESVADQTVLIYLCGADLESKNGLATGDIQEILKVSGQPKDVNIVIETGGASSWKSTYGISSTYLQRHHVENKQLITDSDLTYASMGLTSTLRSFIEYGLNNYPANRTGLILWNHGGGMRGVCYDEKKNDDSLTTDEVKNAVSGALSNCGKSGQKLEWIGYDACLMAVQDIAEMNSPYFNYMIASEESEAGYGWDYDNWVDDLYAKKSTTVILKAIVDSFITDNGGASSSSGDQTLSYMNLSYADEYLAAWEAMATQLNNVVTSSNKSSFNSAITSNVKHYADSDYDYFCTFDAKDFVEKLASNSSFSSFRINSSYTDAVLAQFSNFVAYSVAQKGAGKSYGLCMYWPNSSQYSDVSNYYKTSMTNFSNWRTFCVNKGTHA